MECFNDLDDLVKSVSANFSPSLTARQIIGIDGVDGSGKTTAAKHLAKILNCKIVSIDDYLSKNRGSYVDHVDFGIMQKAIYCSFGNLIVEGICLLEIAGRAEFEIDALVYIKRTQHGIWCDDEMDCDNESVDTKISEIRELARMFSANEQDLSPNSDGNIRGEISSSTPLFREEILRYHAKHRPHLNADYILNRDTQ